MTETAFGRLLYTDCAPGTGRGSSGGFQIQAQSPGVDAQQASFAVGWLLYEAQGAWVAAGRPVEEFPPGFAHACADGYGTSQGRYVGKEAVGGRMGNHLADCLLTRDPERYGTSGPPSCGSRRYGAPSRGRTGPARISTATWNSGHWTWRPSPTGSASGPSAVRRWSGYSACWRTRTGSEC